MLPDAMGVPPPRTREHIKRMILILECGTLTLKNRWPGHPSIPLRVFGPSQYLMMLPVQMTKLKLTLKPLPANSTSKLVPHETQSNAEEHQHIKLTAGGDARRVIGTDVTTINNLVQWFQAISANMIAEAQKRARAASRKATLSVFTDVGDNEVSLIAVQSATV